MQQVRRRSALRGLEGLARRDGQGFCFHRVRSAQHLLRCVLRRMPRPQVQGLRCLRDRQYVQRLQGLEVLQDWPRQAAALRPRLDGKLRVLQERCVSSIPEHFTLPSMLTVVVPHAVPAGRAR